MTGHLKNFIFITVTAVVITLLLGPPLAIAGNLPRVCNIFDKKTTDKAGHCGHRAIFSQIQDKSFQVGAVLIPGVDFETSHFLIIRSNPLSDSFPFGSNPRSSPLRC